MDDAAMAAARERQAEDLGLATRPAEPEPQVVHCIGIELVLSHKLHRLDLDRMMIQQKRNMTTLAPPQSILDVPGSI